MITQDNLKVFITGYNKFYQQEGKNQKCRDIEREVLGLQNVNISYRFAKEAYGADVAEHGKIIAKFGNAKQNVKFAEIPGADTRLHREVVIKSGDIKENLKICNTLKDGLNSEYVNIHGQVILDNGTIVDIFNYLKYYYQKGLNTKPYFDKIIESNNDRINIKTALEIKTADVLRHGRVVINNAIPMSNYVFAKIPGADKVMHEKVVLDGNDECVDFLFIRDIPGCNVKDHARKIVKSNNEVIQKEFFELIRTKFKNDIELEF